MPPRARTRTPRAVPPIPRTPTPAEADLLTVYLDAERYLLEHTTRQVGKVAADERARIAGLREVRAATERVVYALDKGAPARVESILTAAAQGGQAEAARQLADITGRAPGADTIDRVALDRLAAATLDRTSAAHDAILRGTPDAYRAAIARVTPGVLVGAMTRQEAAQRALWALTDQGITGFTDRAGRRWRLSSYVEMATRTAAQRAHTDAHLDRVRADGHRYVQVSDAPRECPRCTVWEGTVLAIDDAALGTVEVESLLGGTTAIVVAGTVAQARAAGLLHPNCRHALSPYLPGVTPPLIPTRIVGGYDAAQRQRQLERHIRAWRERELTALTPAARRHAAAQRKGYVAAIKAHTAEHRLKRLTYREQPGAGNEPGDALRARVGDGNAPLPTLVESAARRPRDMIDAELDREMADALAVEDFDRFGELGDETDRRDEARARARDTARARRQRQREQLEEQRAAEYDRLLAAGADDEEAVERVYGITVARQRRDRAIGELRANGYSGTTFEQLSRSAFRDHVYDLILRAEADPDVGAFMVSREGQARGIDGRDLFTGPAAYAARWASDELKQWWDDNSRPTLAEFRAELLGDQGTARGIRGGRGYFAG